MDDTIQGYEPDLDGVDLFDLAVTEVGDDAAAFAEHMESGGCITSCGCMGGPTGC